MAEFDEAYVFAVDNKEVVIEHAHGKHFRVNPNNKDQADPHGGKGGWARWIVELQANKSQAKIKNKATGRYLRIEPNANVGADNKIDVKGQGGKWTVFKVHKQGQAGHVKLESLHQPGKYLAVQPGVNITVGNGGKWTLLKFWREGEPFTKPYLFAKTNQVVIQHKGGGNFNRFLRVNPNGGDGLDPDGGRGAFAQFEADPQNGGKQVRFKSLKTGKYLRIVGQNVNGGGGGGKFTVFNVLKQGQPGLVKLQSAENGSAYIAVGKNNVIRVGNGGPWTVLNIFRKN